MFLDQKIINVLLEKYIPFINNIGEKNGYNNNIKHLLYIIVPAFIAKYGVTSEPTILKCFENVKVYVREHNENVSAAFNRSLRKDDNGYYTDKFITVNPFNYSTLSEILDNFIHEFNHAVNSINNEIILTDEEIKVRTGLATLSYDKKDRTFLGKSNEIVLEELLNTAQTEEIIEIIKSFSKYDINNTEVSNTLYNLNKEIGNKKYKSDAYYYQKQVCVVLMNNKTFIPTINKLRFKGQINEIPELFDNVIGEKGAYEKLNNLLTEMHSAIIKYNDSKILKNKYISKIKSLTNEVSELILDYDRKCIFR